MGERNPLEVLLGSAGCSGVLVSVHREGETWARKVSRNLGMSLTAVQKQLSKLEDGGILRSRRAGRTRLYSMDPRCPLYRGLQVLLGDPGEGSFLRERPQSNRRPGRGRRTRGLRLGRVM